MGFSELFFVFVYIPAFALIYLLATRLDKKVLPKKISSIYYNEENKNSKKDSSSYESIESDSEIIRDGEAVPSKSDFIAGSGIFRGQHRGGVGGSIGLAYGRCGMERIGLKDLLIFN